MRWNLVRSTTAWLMLVGSLSLAISAQSGSSLAAQEIIVPQTIVPQVITPPALPPSIAPAQSAPTQPAPTKTATNESASAGLKNAANKVTTPSADASSGSQTRKAGKPVVDGNTYVELDKSLNALYTTGNVRSVDLKAMEAQQKKVAELIQAVAVNVRQGAAQGSGVLISNNYVLTAAHVGGRPHQRATVVLSDGTELPAEVLGMNRNVDAGLIKITDTRGKVLPYATVGNSRSLRKGQWVLGAGHPSGWQGNRGYVLRSGRIVEVMKDTLITNVPLIGGDSGGPLFNIRGELIGIHSRIGTDVSDNMHVPIDVFVEDWKDLEQAKAWGVLPAIVRSLVWL